MNNNTNIYDLLNRFWMECERESFTASETALFHFLLYRANRMRWKMPVIGNTAVICSMLSISRQTLCKSREGLVQRGVINFKKGVGPRSSAEYTLLWVDSSNLECVGDNCANSCGLTHDLTHGLTQDGTQQLTQESTQVLTRKLTPYKTIIEENNNNINSNIVKSGDSQKILSLSFLREELFNDDVWKEKLLKVLVDENIISDTDSVNGAKELDSLMKQFFDIQEVSGKTYQNKQECQKHLLNWIRFHHSTPSSGESHTGNRDLNSQCRNGININNNNSNNNQSNQNGTANTYKQSTDKRGFGLKSSSKQKNFDASFV